jgi:hypothetical protein
MIRLNTKPGDRTVITKAGALAPNKPFSHDKGYPVVRAADAEFSKEHMTRRKQLAVHDA